MQGTKRRTLKILEVNLGRGKSATDLMEQIAIEKEVDVITVAEPNINHGKRNKWYMDVRNEQLSGLETVGRQSRRWVVATDLCGLRWKTLYCSCAI